MASTSLNVAELQDAFEVFNQHSGLLEQSYRDLQDTVEAVRFELRREQSARLQELVAKEKLARRLAELLETLPGAIVVLDGEGVVRQQNSQAASLLNEPLIGCSWASIVSRELAEEGIEDGNIQLRDGRWLSLSRRSLRDEPGEVLLLFDVTQSRRIAELRQRNERLTAIGEMTAEFAHQVRTPLATATLYVGQLDTAAPSQARIARKIVNALNEVERMVSDMLNFAAGSRQTQQHINVNDLLCDVADSIAEQLGARTSLRVSVTDKNLTVAANKDAIKGALLNLIFNADQAGRGRANILIHGHRFGDSVHLCVTDDGPGISADVQSRLFEAFFTTRPQGTGLGLSVVKAVAVAHHGEATATSSKRGSCFTIRLPAEQAGEDLL